MSKKNPSKAFSGVTSVLPEWPFPAAFCMGLKLHNRLMRKLRHQSFTWSQSIKGKQEVISRNTIDNSPIEGFIRNWQTQNKNIICHQFKLRKSAKKNGKSVVFCQTLGGSRRVSKSQTSILEKYFFTEHVELI